jgi:hypothetical protein
MAEMTLKEALELAQKYEEEGVISTAAKAVVTLSKVFLAARSPTLDNLDVWIKTKPGWYVKDFTDQWLYFDNEEAARKASEYMNNSLIREVRDGTRY